MIGRKMIEATGNVQDGNDRDYDGRESEVGGNDRNGNGREENDRG